MICTKANKNIRKTVRADGHCIVNTVLTLNCRKNACQVYLLFLDTSNLLTYLLTPWNRVLLEKLTGFQLFKRFPAFYGTRRFITAFTSAPQLSLSWARSIQSMPPHPTSWRSILKLSSHLRLGLPSGLFPSGLLAHIRDTCPAHLILLDFITRTILGEEHRSLISSLCSFLRSPVTSSLLSL